MYLLARKTVSGEQGDWVVVGCLAEETISGYRPLMKYGDEPVLIPNFDPPVKLVEIVGTGAFGIVIRAIDQMRIQRAFKVFLPPKALRSLDNELYKPASWDSYTDVTEITLTNRHPFKHVLAVANHGSTLGLQPPTGLPSTIKVSSGAFAISDNETLPFTVAPLIDGVDLERFFKLIDKYVRPAIKFAR